MLMAGLRLNVVRSGRPEQFGIIRGRTLLLGLSLNVVRSGRPEQ